MEPTKKELLIEEIHLLSDNQINFLYELINFSNCPSKDELLKFCDKDIDTKKIDSAYPIDYFREIEKIYPNLIKGNFYYDYNNYKFGELVNINDLIANKFYDFIHDRLN